MNFREGYRRLEAVVAVVLIGGTLIGLVAAAVIVTLDATNWLAGQGLVKAALIVTGSGALLWIARGIYSSSASPDNKDMD